MQLRADRQMSASLEGVALHPGSRGSPPLRGDGLRSPAKADLGSILGTRPTRGTLSFVDAVGPAKFVAECRRLVKLYGERFKRTRRSIPGRAERHV